MVPNYFTDLDRDFSLKLIELWASFARNGKMPNQQPSNKRWPTSNRYRPKPHYVEINDKYIRKIRPEKVKRCEQFWSPLLFHFKK